MNVNASIVIPVFNEINLIEKFVNNLSEAFKREKVKFIFVDDGSNDGSAEWLKSNLSKIFNKKNYELILLNKNHGKGYAIREGIKIVEGYTLYLLTQILNINLKIYMRCIMLC